MSDSEWDYSKVCDVTYRREDIRKSSDTMEGRLLTIEVTLGEILGVLRDIKDVLDNIQSNTE
ncbi:MAG: hypothetical protein ABI743_07485 [bacterium]